MRTRPEPPDPLTDPQVTTEADLPPGERPLSLARRVLPFALLAGIFLIIVRVASFPLKNNDTFFHLRFGHEFLSGTWSLRDPGSVSTFATADWLPTQWLPQVVMAQTEDWFGLAGVAWLFGLQFLTLALVLFWACRRHAEPLVAALLTMLTLVACLPGLSMRPQMISYILVVVTTAAWLRARDEQRVPWLLIPMTWIWAMSHGMWPVGILIGAVAVVGLALDRAHSAPALAKMAAVPILSAGSALVTPVGPGLVSAVLKVSSRAEYFYEWGPADFTRIYSIALLILLALAIVPRIRRGSVPWFEIALIGLAAAWAVYSLRTLPVAACMAAPLAAAAIQPALGFQPSTTRREWSVVLGGFVASLVALALTTPHSASEPKAFSPWLDGALQDLPVGTKILDDNRQGGFLMWRYPQLDLVSHGYGDTFTDDELDRTASIDGLDEGWYELVQETDVSYAVVDPDSSLGYALSEREGWIVLERDEDLMMLEPPPGWLDD